MDQTLRTEPNVYEKLSKDQLSRKRKRSGPRDESILTLIHQLTDERPTYGYRRITALLRKKVNQAINAKSVYRLMKINGLLLHKYSNRPTRVHDGKIITLKSYLRWCSDRFSIQRWNAEQVPVAFVLDCHDRETISWVASNKGIDGQMIRDLMTECVEARLPLHNHLPHKLQ